MSFTAKDVMGLRQKTGLGMMDCKKALTETGGDPTAAEEWLRETKKGKMDTRTERTTGEGQICVTASNGVAVIIEVQTETDFTAKNENFVEAVEKRGGVVATCSALKRSYRRFILEGVGKPLLFVLLDGDRETLYSRMQKRSNHYMPPSLLDSQLADLERPGADEPVVTYSIEESIDTLLAVIIASLSGTESS